MPETRASWVLISVHQREGIASGVLHSAFFFNIFRYNVNSCPKPVYEDWELEDCNADEAEAMQKVVSFFWDLSFYSIRSYLAANADISS